MSFLEIDLGLGLLAVALAFVAPNLGSRWFEAWEERFGRLARRRGLSVLVVGITALALRAALLPVLPIPQPMIQDEYGYLLLSDTFAHGRLTNPTNPMWAHFENLFILWHPTYTAKFWPAQGLVMALGQVLTGHPFWGVWLSVGLACAAITWMLQGWLGEGWALLGGFLAVIRLGTFSYWANSYWGGAVAALGGALVLGALPRIKQERRVRYALLMGLGLAILANSRPYEGLVFSLPVAAALAVWMLGKQRPAFAVSLRKVVLPVALLLGLTGVWMGYYNWRVTGSALMAPYQLYDSTYDAVPNFPWQQLKTPRDLDRMVFRECYRTLELPLYRQMHAASGVAVRKAEEIFLFWAFFLGPVFTLPLLSAWVTAPYGLSWRDISPRMRFLLIVFGLTLLGEALPIYYLPHYSAPITCVVYALVLAALRRIRAWRWRAKPVGLFFTRAVPSICALLFVLRMGAGVFHWPPVSKWPGGIPPTWCAINPMNPNRAASLARLERYPGRQLVIVHYSPDHDVFFNVWVYNRADLASAKVIWAHDMGPEKNAELIKYYKNRRVWLLYADDQPPKLVPYAAPYQTVQGAKAAGGVAQKEETPSPTALRSPLSRR